MYRRFEGEFVEEENEIKQPNAGQESAAWFPLFLLEVYANYDVSNEPGYRAPAEKKKKNSQPQQQQQQPNTYHLMFHFHICESIKDSSCVCVVFRISRLTLYKFGEREI